MMIKVIMVNLVLIVRIGLTIGQMIGNLRIYAINREIGGAVQASRHIQ